MFTEKLHKRGEAQWEILPFGKMQVPVIVFADDELIREMDQQVYQQAANVAALPGIVRASYMPCRTPIGATASPSAASGHSIQTPAASSRPGALVSISPAACGPCLPA